ncbi:xanthine dehydrogenase family protein molybdopterin-binding subunit [Agaribacterium haliotis]|uniref:xanthine dehydrogenase family protein molybdopterin-binding subunit n=1 Tax=Agaribacterium haliotis TaxID=2013869 RepID=UPI000BB598B4|nr:molybdopterin cofactor-binding domain-containing protein [Agaribacterium haliotis]
MNKKLENISRRSLILGSAKGSLILSASLPVASLVPQALAGVDGKKPKFAPSVYLEISPDDRVVVICHRSEMGQGVRTSIPMVVADELGANWQQIELVQALGDPKYGSQNTDGSSTMRLFYESLREAGALARHMLTQAAAQLWKISADDISVADGKLRYKNKQASFGELAELASTQQVPDSSTLKYKSKKEFKFIGSDKVANIDGVDIVTGRAEFGIDVQKEGMLIAVIARPPVLGSEPIEVDAEAALKVPGVKKVIKMQAVTEPVAYKPLGGVAVLATNTWAAMQGRDKLTIRWSDSAHAKFDSHKFEKQLEKDLDVVSFTHRQKGDAKTALKQADKRVVREYYVPSLAHAPMETPAAAAHWQQDKVELWSATQNPQSAVDSVASQLGVDKAKVKAHVTLLGGGFGRKSKQDFVVEAAYLSKQVGKPVKVIWTREDDIKHGYYQACNLQRISAGFNDKSMTAWQHQLSGPGIRSIFEAGASGIKFEANLGMKDMPFDVANVECTSGPGDAHVRYGWMRSVGNIGTGFAIGSFVDEAAHELKIDSKQAWLDFIGADRNIDFAKEGTDFFNYGESLEKYPYNTKRLKATLNKVADMADWGKKLPKGQGMGLSVHRSFVSNTACCVKVSEVDGKIRVDKVWMVIDAGTAVNKERVHSQMEGSVIFSLSLAFYGEITAKNGVVEQDNFDNYPLLRMDQSPEIEVSILDFDDPAAGGVGEPGVPPVAPALCNAIFAATGKRYRRLPLVKHGIV